MTHASIDFDVAPTLRRQVTVSVGRDAGDVDALAVPTGSDDSNADAVAGRRRAGFTGHIGQALGRPSDSGAAQVVVGVGAANELTVTGLRNVAAAFARSVPEDARLAFPVLAVADGGPEDAATAIVEGILLARYSFSLRGKTDPPIEVTDIRLVADHDTADAVQAGARRGMIIADAAMLARDLANCPGSLLTATRMAEVAAEVGEQHGLQVEVFDKAALIELGCGGLLGVNQASVEEPRMIRLRYAPDNPSGRLSLVGKGIMYDSGGISLKPSDAVHATMKNDMTGAAAVLAAMATLRDLGCPTAVTGYLMCTDNMPSGSALRLGDVITMYGGRTVEVLNTDAEGRLVMADALVLATEEAVDAIVDIATLTGQCLRTLGTEIAGVMGTSQPLVDQVEAAAEATDEPVWQLPLDKRYRNQLHSTIADLTNMGGPNAGSITAGLFLAEFVGDVPFAHIDIAGTAQADAPRGWVPKGPTGSGTRLLINLALNFTPPAR